MNQQNGCFDVDPRRKEAMALSAGAAIGGAKLADTRPLMARLIDTQRNTNDRLQLFAGRLENMADNLFGLVPSETCRTGQAQAPTPSSAVEVLDDLIRDATRLMDAIERNIERLQPVV